MTKIKFCGLRRMEDIEYANRLLPDYVGFVFVPDTRRFVPPSQAARLRADLAPGICVAGVFVNEHPATVARLLNEGTIDIAQLHGQEDDAYIRQLRLLTGGRIIKAFTVRRKEDLLPAMQSTADYILLDSGAGTGNVFDWSFLECVRRPYFLAGGLSPENAGKAVRKLHPYALDVSSGIETEGKKDYQKMAAFAAAVRKEDRS